MTGADAESFTGTVKVKLGPIALVYNGSGTFVEKDEAAHRLVIDAKGKDKRGNGTAGAMVTAVMSEAGPGSTEVAVSTDLSITGKAAQFGRGNVIKDVSDKLLGQFVSCLEQQLVAHGTLDAPPGEESAPAPSPGDATTPASTTSGAPEPAAEPAASSAAGNAADRRSSSPLRRRGADSAPSMPPSVGAPPVRRRLRRRRHRAAGAAARLLEARGRRGGRAARGGLPAGARLTARSCVARPPRAVPRP